MTKQAISFVTSLSTINPRLQDTGSNTPVLVLAGVAIVAVSGILFVQRNKIAKLFKKKDTKQPKK